MKKTITWGLVLALAALVGWRAYDSFKASGPTAARGVRPVAVVVESVRTADMRHTAEFTGTLLPRAQFVVAPSVAGRLERLHVNIGDTVRKGQLIAELDSREYAQQVAQAHAELEVAKANVIDSASALDVARRDLNRARSLLGSNVVSQAEFDKAEATFNAGSAKHQVALAQVRQKEAALEAARVRLAYTRIHADWENGDLERVVGERFTDEGAMLRANDPIVSVVALDPLLAVVNVIERDFPLVSVGQSAEVMADAHPGRLFQGRVARRSPVLQEASRQGRVEILVPNEQRLLAPGMFATVRLSFTERSGVTAVPTAALATRDGRRGVFLADPEALTAHFLPVSVGIIEGPLAEIVEPSLDGLVVTLGQHLLEDGAAISMPALSAKPGKSDEPGGPGEPGEPSRSAKSAGVDGSAKSAGSGGAGESGGADVTPAVTQKPAPPASSAPSTPGTRRAQG